VTGFNGYVEWIPGDLPIVVTAPHGGTLSPTEIPDRTTGTTTRDLNTDELAHEVVNAFVERFGKRPHLIVCKLHRRKLDANRAIVEAAAGNPVAERTWREYHGFIEASIADVRRGPGTGFYVDLHGHGHDIQRLELGYLVSAAKLALTDQQLALDLTMMSSSLWSIASTSSVSFPSVLRGSSSLGA
jgi:N-formylglutamate amidohydrolase